MSHMNTAGYFDCFFLAFKVPVKRIFFSHERANKNWKTAVYRFSISSLVLELQNFEDSKIKAKTTDTKHAILVMSHTGCPKKSTQV